MTKIFSYAFFLWVALSFLPTVYAGPCENIAFSKQGVDSYSSALSRETADLLGRNLSDSEKSAIETANRAHPTPTSQAEREQDKHVQSPGWGSNQPSLKKKIRILKSAGFSKEERRALIENGIVWSPPIYSHNRLIKSLKQRQGSAFETAPASRADKNQESHAQSPDWGSNKTSIYFYNWTDKHGRVIGRINKILRKTNHFFEVEVEILSDNGWKSTIETYRINRTGHAGHNMRIVHPDMQVVFEAFFLKKEKVDREDIKLPPRTNMESQLKAKGYGPVYYKGMDDLHEWSALRQQLIANKANPWTTHIPYFADKIEEHINFSADSLRFFEKRRGTKVLEQLKEKSAQAISEERVTYKWWLELNMALSQLRPHLDSNHIGDVIFIVSLFPQYVIIPTLLGNLGIMTLSRAPLEGVFPIGLINKNITVDGQNMSPHMFLRHDVTHMNVNLFPKVGYHYSAGHYLRHKKIQELMESLPMEKRKQAELVYFLFIHEGTIDRLLHYPFRQEVRNYLTELFVSALHEEVFSIKMAGLGQEYSRLKPVEKIQYIEENIVDIFMEEVYDKTF